NLMTRKKKNFFRKLMQKHTLIILNEDEQEEQFSFRLNRMNVLVVIALMTFFTILCTTLTLLFTPIKDYLLPNDKQVDVRDKQELLNLSNQLDSLEMRQKANDLYIKNIRAILAGEVPIPPIDTTKRPITSVDLSKVDLSPQKEDLKLRSEVEQEEMFNINGNQYSQEAGSLLFTPLKGIITSTYEPEINHLAIDIAAQ